MIKSFLVDLYYSFMRLWAIIRPQKVYWKKLHDQAQRPVRAYHHDGAFDITAVEEIHLAPNSHVNVGCGIAIQIGPGMSYDIRGRSGLNRRGVIAAIGLVDSFYHGELRVVLSNHSGADYVVKRGDRVAQIKFNPVLDFDWKEVEEFPAPEGTRGSNGWGSSGR